MVVVVVEVRGRMILRFRVEAVEAVEAAMVVQSFFFGESIKCKHAASSTNELTIYIRGVADVVYITNI